MPAAFTLLTIFKVKSNFPGMSIIFWALAVRKVVDGNKYSTEFIAPVEQFV